MGDRTCMTPGCERAYHARGRCKTCYARWQHYADDAERCRPTPEERFWVKVDRSGGPDACWVWTATLTHNGYGRFYLDRNRSAHVVSYTWAVGPIPDGLELDHLCHTNDPSCALGNNCPHRRCVNPKHLEPVEPLVNALRGRGNGQITKTHCPRGHPYSGSNLAIYKGWRHCRACREAHR
jgi:hypothetical protein